MPVTDERRRADWIRLSADGEDNRQGHESGRQGHQDDVSQTSRLAARSEDVRAATVSLVRSVIASSAALHFHLVTGPGKPGARAITSSSLRCPRWRAPSRCCASTSRRYCSFLRWRCPSQDRSLFSATDI